METILEDDNLQIVKLELAAGCCMPRHVATSDAYLVVEEGHALLIYHDETCELKKGGVSFIPANQQHMLKIVDDLKGYIVLTGDARIEYPGQHKHA